MLGVLGAVAPASAHHCLAPIIRMTVGQTLDDVFSINADHEEDVTKYTLIAAPDFLTVEPLAPGVAYSTHDLFLHIRADAVGVGTIQIHWDYAPTFTSDDCSHAVIVSDVGESTSSGDHRHSGLGGDPVNTLTGEFVMQEPPDLVLPGPMTVFFQRYYGSALERLFVQSRLGVNWRHNYDWTIHQNGNALALKDSRGRLTRFLKTDTINNTFTQQNNLDLPLTVKQEILPAENHYHVLDPRTNQIYKFSIPTGADRFYLVEIRDGRGNALALDYNVDGELETVSDGLGRALTFTYRDFFFPVAPGALQSVSDGTRTVTFTHDGSFQLIGVQDAVLKTTGYAYTIAGSNLGLMTQKNWPEGNAPWMQTWDSQARVATQTTADGDLTTFTYDASSTTISDPRSNESTLAHDGSGNLTSSTDAANRTRTIGYDGTGNRNAVEQPLGALHLRSYDPASANVASVTNDAGNTVTYQYSSRAVAPGFSFRELTGIAFPDGRSQTYVYDANGNQTSFTDRGDDSWTRTFNARSQPLTETSPLGGTTTYAYNADATLASVTDSAGRITAFQYDAVKRTTRVTRPDGAFRQFGWDARDRLTSFRNEAGGTTSYSYDGNGRLVMKVDPSGAKEMRSYDAMNRIASVTDRTGAVINVTDRDALGGPASVELVGQGTVAFEYGDDGRLAGFELPDASQWSTSFDASGRFTGITNPAGESQSAELDGDDLVVSRTDAAGEITHYEHDVLGRIASITDPSGIKTSMEFDAEDAVSRVAVGPLDVHFEHDAIGSITQVVDLNGGTWSWTYNNRGLPTAATDPLGRTTAFAYDNRDRVSMATYPGGLGNVQVTYDGVGNATRRLHSDGVDISYTLDAQGLLTGAPGLALGYDARHRVTSSNGITATRKPHVGQVATLILAAGKTVTYAYDAAGRATTVTDWLGGVTTFSYDAAGQRTGIQRPNGAGTTFGYDLAGRLAAVTHGASGSIALTRDAAGRLTAATRNLPAATPATATASFTYDVASQPSGFVYDALGRRTGGAGRTYTWDLASRLTSVVEGPVTTTLGWDAFGRLTSLDSGTTNRDYVWNYALPVPAISIESEDGAALRHYVHDPSGRLLYAVDAATNARHFFHFDERGNTVFVTDGDGAVEASWAYGPYGEVSASNADFDNPFTFVGEWNVVHLASGLFQMGRRSYDVATTAFLSRDPVHPHLHPLTFNPYQYAGRDPIGRIDPWGADPVDAAAANQQSGAQGVVATAANTVNTVTSVSNIAGDALGDAADETRRASGRAFGEANLKLGRAEEVIEMNRGGNAVSRGLEAAHDGLVKESFRLEEKAMKLADQSRTLKAVGAASNALNAVEIGVEVYKLYDKILEAHAFNDSIESGLYRTFVSQSTTAWDVYHRGKQNEYWLRKRLIDIQYHLKYQLLYQGYLHSLENHINFWTAVGNIYGAFLPGFGFVGTEGVADAAHNHFWGWAYAKFGNPWD